MCVREACGGGRRVTDVTEGGLSGGLEGGGCW